MKMLYDTHRFEKDMYSIFDKYLRMIALSKICRLILTIDTFILENMFILASYIEMYFYDMQSKKHTVKSRGSLIP